MLKNFFFYIFIMSPLYILASGEPVPASPDIKTFLSSLNAKYPQTVKGWHSIPSPEVLNALRTLEMDPTNSAAVILNSHYLQEIYKQYGEALGVSPLENIDFGQTEMTIRAGPLGLAKLAHGASALSTPNPGIRDLLERIFVTPTFLGRLILSHTTDWKKPIIELLSNSIGDKISRDEFPREHGDYLSKLAEESLKKILGPNPVWISFPGNTKLGLTTITRLLLDDIHIIALPTKPDIAHGISLSPIEFLAHDCAHFEKALNDREETINRWSSHLAQQLMKKHHVEYEVATYIAGNLTRFRLKKVQDLAKNLLDHATKVFLRSAVTPETKRAYNKILVCLFEVFHEDEGITTQMLNAQTSGEMIHALFQGFTTLKMTEDPFQTNPLTGDSALDGAARESLINSMMPQQSNEYLQSKEKRYVNFAQLKERGLILEDTTTPLEIIIRGKFPDGSTVRTVILTLKFLFGDAKDRNALLTLAGYGIPVPDLVTLATPEAQREEVLGFINTVNQRLEALGQEVIKEALALIHNESLEPEFEAFLHANAYILGEKHGLFESQYPAVREVVNGYKLEKHVPSVV